MFFKKGKSFLTVTTQEREAGGVQGYWYTKNAAFSSKVGLVLFKKNNSNH